AHARLSGAHGHEKWPAGSVGPARQGAQAPGTLIGLVSTSPWATFPRSARLVRPSQYRSVFANARKYTGAGFVVLAADNDVGHARLGMAIAKKRLRRAVDRNRIRRTVRESFR